MSRRAKLRNLLARLITLLASTVPRFTHVVVAGTPAEEGNAVEIVRALASRHKGTVYWIGRPDERYLRSLGFDDLKRIRPLAIGLSAKSAFLYASASAVFFTHGVFGLPTPGRKQTVVNLWHGEPIKGGALFPDRRLSGKPATYLIGSSELLTAKKAELSGMQRDDVLLVGNPRTDQFTRPAAATRLAILGIDTARPFVLWMPTFRVARTNSGSIAWSNTTDEANDSALATSLEDAVAPVLAAGIQVVVKPHPLDYRERSVAGAITVTNEDLRAAGVGLYQMLGAAAGLISDYSSVWVDFLHLDRPIALFIPDLEGFAASRGYFPDWIMQDMPGHLISDSVSGKSFAEEVLNGSNSTATRRQHVASRLGLRHKVGDSADALLDELSRRTSLSFEARSQR